MWLYYIHILYTFIIVYSEYEKVIIEYLKVVELQVMFILCMFLY